MNSTIHSRPLFRILCYIQTQIEKFDLGFVFNHNDTVIIVKKISTDLQSQIGLSTHENHT